MVLGVQRWVLFPRYATAPDPTGGRDVHGLVRYRRPLSDRRGEAEPERYVEAWFLPGQGASVDRPGPAVIFAHGNAELIDYWPDTLEHYRQLGVGVLLPEYRGYGRSAGSPSQTAITSDFVYFHDELAARPDVDPARIFFHGRSLGGGAVCALAEHRRPRAMILMSTFTSIADMARRYLLPRFLVLDPFDNERVLSRLDVPVLLLHGTHDGLVPYEHARRLQAVAKDARLVSYPADHNDCPPDWERFWAEVTAFLRNQGILDAR